MKAGIFDPYLDTIGGGERYAMTVAEVLLKKDWQVDIFWNDDKSKQKLINRFSLDISGVNFLPYSPRVNNLFGRYKIERNYDFLFYFSDGSIPLMFGKKNILHFQVPFKNVLRKSLKNSLKLKTIDAVVCNSYFTKTVIDKCLEIKSLVVYPPVDVEAFMPLKKENIILAVGRFEKSLTEKRQDILIETFKKMIDNGLKSWKLVIAGGCSADENKNEILNVLKNRAKSLPIEIKVNLPFSELKELYAKAKIFWHAAGYGADEEKNPEKVEHFGMTTVEAMAAGCVPIVQDKGGQKEIVEEGKSGFLWLSVDELVTTTLKVIQNNELSERISTNAIQRSKDFSKEKFYEKIYSLVEQ